MIAREGRWHLSFASPVKEEFMGPDLSAIDAVETLQLFESGRLSPMEYAEGVIARATQYENLNALHFFDADYLRSAVQSNAALHRDAPLAGLPLVVKANINTRVYPTSGCTRSLLENTPQEDAGSLAKLVEQGAFVGAKAGMHEIAFGITSNNEATGAIRNPHDPELIAGGSSGGTASAIAAGIFAVGLGTDTGGS
jgi:mandelamide amidase